MKVKISELQVGDLVDLENDPYADPCGTNQEFPFELAQVIGTERETADCIRVDFHNFLCGFPPDHVVSVEGREGRRMSSHAWSYFNGGPAGWNDARGYHPPEKMTAAYCAACAPDNLPGYDKAAPAGREHWNTSFRCAPWRVGMPCSACGKDI